MILPRELPRRDVVADYDLAQAKRRAHAGRLLGDARERVLAAYDAYESAKGSPNLLCAMPVDEITKKALVDSYDLTYERRPLSSLRFDVMGAAYEGICPMCGDAQVSTLDHYLPKETFPEFSILVSNLIPACSDCNRNKLSFIGSEEEGCFPHVYFDDLEPFDPIFGVKVEIADGDLIVSFSISEGLPEPLYSGILVQFEKLRLGTRYSWAAKKEILERLDTFREALLYGGRESVSATASKQCRVLRRRFGKHYWKAALYEGIGRSNDFCEGRFDVLMVRMA